MSTKIEWTEKTWNPITGCTKISPGCANCYAEKMAQRLAGRYGYDKDEPFKVTYHSGKLGEPLNWKKPSMVFVCSMGDLFHEDVTEFNIAHVFAIIAQCPQHTFQILTKRPERARALISGINPDKDTRYTDKFKNMVQALSRFYDGFQWPLPNVWLGVTAENQEQADKRIPVLLGIPAAVRFVSVEPMLERVLLTEIDDGHGYHNRLQSPNKHLFWTDDTPRLDWVICGGETGQNARPMNVEWARDLRDQCAAAGVPFFFKKVSGKEETPDDLMVRQRPGGNR